MAKKKSSDKIDGEISPKEVIRLRGAIRQVWGWESLARRICLKRAALPEDFAKCELCKKIVSKVYADHIEVMGSPTASDYIVRMWCHSSKLQALCKKCHGKKTRQERIKFTDLY